MFGISCPTRLQVSPPSALCRSPSTSIPAQMLLGLAGSIAKPVIRGTPTAGHSSAMSTGRWLHVAPPSVERKIPHGVGVPVPANMTLGLLRSMARLHTQ